MYIIQNAIKNIIRNKGRNIMIAVIIFAIILTTVVALIINNTSDAVIENYREKFSSEVSIQPDMQKVMEEAQRNSTDGRIRIQQPQISTELQVQFADSEYLKETSAIGQITANSDDIRAIDQSDQDDSLPSTGGMVNPSGGSSMAVSLGSFGNYRIYGDYWTDFEEGNRSLVDDGKSVFPQNDNECIISDDLAVENGVNVGDKLTFSVSMSIDFDNTLDAYADLAEGDTITINGIEYTVSSSFMSGRGTREVLMNMTVVGIYNDLTDEYPMENMSKMAAMNKRNEILTTLDTLLSYKNKDEAGITMNVKYYLKNPDLLDDFEKEVRAKGLSELFTVSTDINSYDSIVKPVVGLKSISITFMIVVIVLGAVILLLLCSIAIRERKYEIGVLRAMGMKKIIVAFGLWFEIFAITCMCLAIGLGIGYAVTQPVSDVLLNMQAENQASDSVGNNMMGIPNMQTGNRMMGVQSITSSRFMNGSATIAQPLTEMKISLDLITILEIIMIAILLSSFAGIVSISKITKYEPIKILMERN